MSRDEQASERTQVTPSKARARVSADARKRDRSKNNKYVNMNCEDS